MDTGNYFFSTQIKADFAEAEKRLREALAAESFGIVSEIDFTQNIKNKLGAAVRPYKVLGACLVQSAFKALQHEKHIGLLMPCNTLIQETEPGVVEISVVDTMASMGAVRNADLKCIADEVRLKLQKVILRLEGEI
ncbi:MAG: DUF302 domain-containing protein [Bacteroidales bacterium]|nr:DUF302 domain-containing protein [Bacteroidales bacterium]MDD3665261.1 DUF302 domain-containing protein [Bacteroidales bacterium]